MIHRELFIVMLIITLLIIATFFKCNANSNNSNNSNNSEYFELGANGLNNFSCDDNPLNSNCVCESEKTKQRILGDFPMNYGLTSPYIYTCANKNIPEPKTTLWTTN